LSGSPNVNFKMFPVLSFCHKKRKRFLGANVKISYFVL
jgi:hypothetical protein